MLGVLTVPATKEAPVSEQYDGKQYVGIDLHRQRSVIVRMTRDGERLEAVRIANDPVALGLAVEAAGPNPEVVLEATYGWYWAVDALRAAGANVHLAHPLGVKAFAYRRVKNDLRDAADLADLLRMGRLPEAWIAPPEVRQLRDLVRYRAKLVAIRSGLKAQVHSVLGKAGVLIPAADIFGVGGRRRLEDSPLAAPYAARVRSLLDLIDVLDREEHGFATDIAARLNRHPGLHRDPGAARGRPHPGRGLYRRDRRRPPVHRTHQAVQLGRADPPPPRVRHRGAPRPRHQTGQQAGALGRRRGHSTPDHHEDRRRPGEDRRPPRHERRQGRRRPQAARPRLPRAARRAHPRAHQTRRMSALRPRSARVTAHLSDPRTAWSRH
jgi:hypothetical protein